MTVFMLNALLNNPELLCWVIAFIKWHFKKIIIVLELIVVFNGLCAWKLHSAEEWVSVRETAIKGERF